MHWLEFGKHGNKNIIGLIDCSLFNVQQDKELIDDDVIGQQYILELRVKV